MPSNGDNIGLPSRRDVLKNAGTVAGLFATAGITTAAEDPQSYPVEKIAFETATNPVRQVVAFTTTVFGDGLELYIAKGIDDPSEVPKSVDRVTDSEAGVHGLSWESPVRLRYSQDGRTVERQSMGWSRRGASVTVVDDDPLPVRDGQVELYSGFVYCTNIPFVTDYCIRLDGSDSGHSPQCRNYSPPAMTHGHFAIYRKGDYRSGINIWIGQTGNCFRVGEEHSTNWCTRVCGPEGGTPSLSELKNAFEEAINRAADAAGIAIPGLVVTALAYYLAASTLAPPTGVPGV